MVKVKGVLVIDRLLGHFSRLGLNSFAEACIQIYSKHESDYNKVCAKVLKERERFKAELEKIPYLKVYYHKQNHFLVEVLKSFSARTLTIRLLQDYF